QAIRHRNVRGQMADVGGQVAVAAMAPLSRSVICPLSSHIWKECRHPLGKRLCIVPADAVVPDRASEVAEARFESGAALGRLERSGGGLVRPEEVDERRGSGEHALHAVAAL